MLNISRCVEKHLENFKACWKTVICVENYVETACWTFQCVLKTVMQVQNYVEYFKACWKLICIENYVETACWKFQCVLKTVMHVENYVEISRCVENVYVRHVENRLENCVEIWKKTTITLYGACWKLRWQRSEKLGGRQQDFESEFYTRKLKWGHIEVPNPTNATNFTPIAQITYSLWYW